MNKDTPIAPEVIVITPYQLKEIVRVAVEEGVSRALERAQAAPAPPNQSPWMKGKEVCAFLRICRNTLLAHVNAGRLRRHWIQGHTFPVYSRDEVATLVPSADLAPGEAKMARRRGEGNG